MSENVFFKVKSAKQNNPETRSTLDAIHSQRIGELQAERERIPEFKQQITVLEEQLAQTSNVTEIWRIEQKIEGLKRKLSQLENNDEIMDYYLRTGSILFDYYDVLRSYNN